MTETTSPADESHNGLARTYVAGKLLSPETFSEEICPGIVKKSARNGKYHKEKAYVPGTPVEKTVVPPRSRRPRYF